MRWLRWIGYGVSLPVSLPFQEGTPTRRCSRSCVRFPLLSFSVLLPTQLLPRIPQYPRAASLAFLPSSVLGGITGAPIVLPVPFRGEVWSSRWVVTLPTLPGQFRRGLRRMPNGASFPGSGGVTSSSLCCRTPYRCPRPPGRHRAPKRTQPNAYFMPLGRQAGRRLFSPLCLLLLSLSKEGKQYPR